MENGLHELLGELEDKIENGKKVLFTNQYTVDREELLGLLQMVRSELPDAISEAGRILKQESRILLDAKKTADNVMAEAEAKARTQLMNSEQRATLTLSNAKEKAQEIQADAKRQAELIIENAERKADELTEQTTIMLRAEAQAKDLLIKARAEAERTRMASIDHVGELLRRVEDKAIEVANELRAARLQMDQSR